ncbi:VOC family protein [Microbulbifer spongiae]|uniref:VOC family protein n=1 Tax=Microbulbifer spongiae TaxID=2944933 RepID=A0ABY9EBC3_9GAMM|nr:VOC family protein [Microbulbifer sp. MI-G]WKD49661.1 VOC family protein [Microbulbifer sp. MI-G]
MNSKIRTCLWFEKGGLEAAHFYTSLISNSALDDDENYGSRYPLVVNFTLAGAPYQILNGGPHYKPSPAASISVLTETQAETDRLWNALTEDGGAEGRCAWLTDRWGVSWQIVPRALLEMFKSTDRKAAERAEQAMLEMNKIDIATLEAAYNGD